MVGVVLNVNIARGFGFVSQPGAPDAFFRKEQLMGLEFNEQLVGLRVEFDAYVHEQRPRARNVRQAA